MIQNPVLPGFHPDPSILRVGDDYYIATSTFEWWPGVRIHHSRDLKHWRHHSYALTRTSQLDMRGNPDSCGIWAPCLTYAHGLFWLIYTNVRTLAGAYKDTHNYVVTAESIDGPWSEPVYLNSSGFDPSFFHDDDGRTWLLNMEWSHRAGRTPFAGILLQEYSRDERKLVGPIRRIFEGSSLGRVEGPHLYKRDGWHYLLTAEGGTGFEHAVTLARSRDIAGPYELPERHPLITAYHKPFDLLQRAGHGSLVETQNGEWYIAHLCSRPIECETGEAKGYEDMHCILGRETALQRVEWTEDGWLRTAHGDSTPAWQAPSPDLPDDVPPADPIVESFDKPALSQHFNSLRVPMDSGWVRPADGALHLRGRESLRSHHDQSIIARRQTALHCVAETALRFEPESYQQMAGLIAYYNTQNHAYLCITHDESLGRVLRVLGSDKGIYREWSDPIPAGNAHVKLRVVFEGAGFRFLYSFDDGAWQEIGPTLPSAMLSDEYATRFEGGYARSFGFTGNFLGMACQDLSGRGKEAAFEYFRYETKVR
jgi:xylan 1,4-beta-xylosidase